MLCYDKVQINIHLMVLHYRDEDIKVLSCVSQSGIMAHSVSSTLELHQTVPLINTIHFVIDCPNSQYRNSSICALVGQTQLTRTLNKKGKRLFVIWYTTCQLSLTGGWPRMGFCDSVEVSIMKKADNLVKSGHVIKTNVHGCANIPFVLLLAIFSA